MHDNPWHARLAYAGALPFAGCAVLAWLGIETGPGLGTAADIAAGYGLAIVSFLAGIHWGTYLYNSTRSPLNLLVTSNVITVAVWLTFAFAPVTASLLVTAAAFVMLLLVDISLARDGLLSGRYILTRRNLTMMVVVLLLLTSAAS